MNRLLASRSIGRLAAVVIASFVVWACDGPAAPDGGGGPMDGGGGEGGTTFTCSRDSDCGDRSLFCADWRCRPGEPGTDARGCIDLGPPCDGGACDEEADRCGGVPSWCTEGRDGCLAPGDCDGDGEPATECGGHDCDDSDGSRYPGNPEVCDAAHRDEDCDPTTLGDTDADGDTFISSACCNSQPDGSLRCGDDCADDDVNRNPSAAESCNGLDDDCDGVLDDGGGLCPGGSCVGGVCDFDAWDRTFGAGSTDSARDVAIDSSGAVYIAGEIRGSADFGAGPRTVTGATTNPRGLFVVSYTADGTHRWDYVSPAASALESVRLAVSPDGARVYAVGYASGADFGSGATEGAFVLVLDGASGAYLIDRRYGNVGEELRDVVADAAGVTAVGRFDSTTSWGGPSRDRAGSVSGVVLRLDREGAYEWDRVIHATGTSSSRRVEVNAVDRLPTGEIVIGGRYGGGGGLELGDTLPVPSTSAGGSFVARLSAADAEPMWARALQATLGFVTVESVAVGLEDRVFVVGRYMQSLVPGTGDSFTTDSSTNGYVTSFLADGTPDWARSFGGDGGSDTAYGVDTDSAGSVVVVGDYITRTDFGGGPRTPASREGFLARYTATGAHQRDFPYGTGGSATVRSVAVGPGNSTVVVGEFSGSTDLGTGPRSSNGMQDAFVLRLGS